MQTQIPLSSALLALALAAAIGVLPACQSDSAKAPMTNKPKLSDPPPNVPIDPQAPQEVPTPAGPTSPATQPMEPPVDTMPRF